MLDSPSPPGAPSLTEKKKYVRAVGPRLRVLLYFIFGMVALLGANSAYLSAVTGLEWATGRTYQNYFYQYMFLVHLVLGLLLVAPFVVFGTVHMLATRSRRNRRAVRIGYALFSISIAVLATGVLLMRVGGFDLRQPLARDVVYWLHVLTPLVAAWLYWLHRLAGPKIKWRIGLGYVGMVGAVVLAMVWLQAEDPRNWYAKGPESGTKYFEPSLARTASGNFIPAESMMNDQYCLKCHADVHAQWSDSVHRFSSFNNPPYLASVTETREVALKRDGNVQASRWCAGCHDPVPFFSGAFDDPKFDTVNHVTAQSGITCSVCHAITHVNSTRGNADFTIEEPLQYPFAYSENPLLQWINNQLVKAKPAFHKKTFLKDFHRSAEFCSTCHKVSLPLALNHYKEFLRGQNHYDPFLLSGVSGHGARSFYYPPKSEPNCSACHMPLKPSQDFGAKFFADAKELSVHNHLFPAANTGIAWLRDRPDIVQAHQEFLKGVMRVDVFGVRAAGEIDGKLIAPLRPNVPTLEPGKKYLIETVIRTVKLGHLFTQGTVDSNEVWLDVIVKSGDRVIGRSGAMDPQRGNEVDPWSHFVNVFMLDKDGNRIDRRNPQDIFTPLYNHQIPPGAGQTVHYELDLPEGLDAPITVEVKLQYRKFDQQYMDFVARSNEKLGSNIRGHVPGEPYRNELPVTTLAVDSITFPVTGSGPVTNSPPVATPEWQRWNDYGIGLLLKGKGELRQAAEAFTQVEQLHRWDGPMNLARAYNVEGRLDEAVAALQRANAYSSEAGYPRWTWAWLSGDINRQQGRLNEAIQNLRSVLNDRTKDMQQRGFDFSYDYEVINLLGQSLFDLGRLRARQGKNDEARQAWQEAVDEFQKTLALDSENVNAHHNLQLLYADLGDTKKSREHELLHLRYKADDNAQGRAERLARALSGGQSCGGSSRQVFAAATWRTGTRSLRRADRGDKPRFNEHRRRPAVSRARTRKSSEPDVDLDTDERDDAIIGVALRRSFVVIGAIAVCVGTFAYFARSRVPQDVVKESVLSKVEVREQPKVEPPHVSFTDITELSGVNFRHENAAHGQKLLPEAMGGGCAFFDFDGDGDQDLLVVNSLRHWPWDKSAASGGEATAAIYRNDGTGKFADVTAGSGLDVPLYGMGVAVGDYDGDGRVDVFISAVGADRLFHNDGSGKFRDVTQQAQVGGTEDDWGTGCGWFDYDQDGDLDLFVCNYLHWSREYDESQNFQLVGGGRAYGRPQSFEGTFPFLYRNDGGGRFTEVAEAAGLHVRNAATDVAVAKSLGVTFADVDSDGWIDVIVANDTVQNFLFKNQGDGTFREIGVLSGVAFDMNGVARGAMGIDIARFRDNGALGIAIGNFANEMTALYVSYENEMQFMDEAISTGLGPNSRLELKFGLFFWDYDLDGRLDLFTANGHLEDDINRVQPSQHYEQPPHLFWNCGPEYDTEFLPVSEKLCGADFFQPLVGRGASYADVDDDGDLDVLVTAIGQSPRLLRNDQQLGNSWLRFKLTGTHSNRDAIGAWIEVELKDRVLRRQVMPTRSYLSQVELPVTIGLGPEQSVRRVTVHWPDGSRQDVDVAELNRTYEVRQTAKPQPTVEKSLSARGRKLNRVPPRSAELAGPG